METYKAGTATFERQEGDTGGIMMELFDDIVLPGMEIDFMVFDNARNVVFQKTTPDWTITGNKITTELHEDDTFGKPGNHVFELQVYNSTVIHTVIRGTFNILPSRIRLKRH